VEVVEAAPRVLEMWKKVGSPSSTRIELSASHLLKKSSGFSPTCVESHSPDDLLPGLDSNQRHPD
jgi:hypothetical protein